MKARIRGVDFTTRLLKIYTLFQSSKRFLCKYIVNPQLNRWTPAVTTRVPVASQLRSYSFKTSDGAQLQRYPHFIRPAATAQPGTIPVASQVGRSPQYPLDFKPETTRKEWPTCTMKKPERLIETTWFKTFLRGEMLHYCFSFNNFLVLFVRVFNL